MTIPPAGYLVDGLLGAACILAVADSGSNASPYVFGDTFMRNFYVTFDYSSQRVSFGVSANAPAGVSITTELGLWQIVAIVAGCIIGLALLVIIVCCIYKKRQQRKH